MAHYRYHFLAVILILLDQVTKVAVKGFTLFGYHHEGMMLGESKPFIGEAVRFTFVENPGMAFGISWGEAKIVLTLLTFAITGFLAWYLRAMRDASWQIQLAFSLLLAGATGNLIDRAFYGVFYNEGPLFYGLVVDFIQVNIPDINWFGIEYTHFPVFNIADSCVSVGIVMLLIFGGKMPSVKKNADADSLSSSEASSPETDVDNNENL